jgi:tetratricopeptide (TPR) repeat protein
LDPSGWLENLSVTARPYVGSVKMARKSSMSAHQPEEPRETLEDRWLLEAQTARNLEGLAAEQAGQVDEAIALYERNVREGFPGDLPYGRLVALYERRGALDDAERVLRRAIEVFSASGRRTLRDRRATIRVFKNRLALLEDLRRAQRVQKQDQ